MKAVMAALTVLLAGMLGASAAQATLIHQTIEYSYENRNFKSYLVYDDQLSGKRPGILVFPEWWGLNNYAKMRADQLADMGYVALAVDLYGNGRTTAEQTEAAAWSTQLRESGQLLGNARAAFEQLAKAERADPAQLAAMGFCFGGEAALKFALSGADLKSLVVFHGTLFAPTTTEAGQVKPPILFLHGSQDPFASLDTVRKLLMELDRQHKDWQMVIYSETVHAFTNPNAGSNPQSGLAYNARSAERAWKQMQVFFDETFPVDRADAAIAVPSD